MDTKEINLGSLILPEEVFTHFELVNVADGPKEMALFLDEKFVPPAPSGYSSKGFTEQLVIQDFPLRGKAIFCMSVGVNGSITLPRRLFPINMTLRI